MQPVPESERMEAAPDCHFRLGVLALDPRHHTTAGGGIHHITRQVPAFVVAAQVPERRGRLSTEAYDPRPPSLPARQPNCQTVDRPVYRTLE